MAPLAGKPPYATDLPDSYYKQSPQPRQQRQPPPDPNSRSSAYDLYDSYFDPSTHRNSGMDAVGLGFLTGDMDDDDDDSDEVHDKKQTDLLPDKHVALAAATGVHNIKLPNIAAPKPGYAAPIAALNLARPEAAAGQNGRPMYNSPSPMSISTPHPLDPPLSPITPAFARPRPAKTDVSFSLPEKPIMRGDAEETLIPKRGERGDDFWRRFSMIAKEESRKSPTQKQSAWLRKTQNGSNRLALWVWIVGIILVLAAAGGVGLGVYFSRNSPSNQQPTAIGGSADQAQAVSSSTMKTVGTGGTAHVQTSLHVSPTNTVARRVFEPRFTSGPMVHRRRRH